jgi:formylmethanofuran dehydrogenase subunit E
MTKRITLKEAVKFHGHLGPYLVLGLLIGEFAMKRLNCRRYFGIKVRVRGANKKPKSCLIDGLQLSTGATYGKGNISKFSGNNIQVEFLKNRGGGLLRVELKPALRKKLNILTTHEDSEDFAKKLYKDGVKTGELLWRYLD